MTENTNAKHAQQHIDWSLDWMADEGDTPQTGLANAILASAYAQLAVADEIRANGATALAQQQAAHNAQAFRDEIERGLTPAKPTDQQIQELAADLWAADPGNQANPAQRFQDDYAHRQDQYLAMARAALGITDQPTQKDSRRP